MYPARDVTSALIHAQAHARAGVCAGKSACACPHIMQRVDLCSSAVRTSCSVWICVQVTCNVPVRACAVTRGKSTASHLIPVCACVLVSRMYKS
jgi:hypothetical protein